jgi:hypothetical protein
MATVLNRKESDCENELLSFAITFKKPVGGMKMTEKPYENNFQELEEKLAAIYRHSDHCLQHLRTGWRNLSGEG